MPDSAKIIGQSAFMNCIKLENIEIPASVKKIYAGAFENCTNAKQVILPFTVENIGRDAFRGVPKEVLEDYEEWLKFSAIREFCLDR